MIGLEIKIIEFIECTYKVKFIGTLKVDISDFEYCLKLTTNNPMNPIVICSQSTSDDEVYNFITKEILLRNLLKVDYLKLEKTNERKSE